MKKSNIYHVIEEGILYATWLTHEEATELYNRLCSCFPAVNFEIRELTTLAESGLMDSTGNFM